MDARKWPASRRPKYEVPGYWLDVTVFALLVVAAIGYLTS
jgi:hypothetical protein